MAPSPDRAPRPLRRKPQKPLVQTPRRRAAARAPGNGRIRHIWARASYASFSSPARAPRAALEAQNAVVVGGPILRRARGCPHVLPRLDGDALLRQQRPMHMTTRPHKRAVALKLPQVLYISYRDALKRSGARQGGPGTCCKAPAWPRPHAAPGARCRSGALKRATKLTV